jgi:hypothetical protein
VVILQKAGHLDRVIAFATKTSRVFEAVAAMIGSLDWRGPWSRDDVQTLNNSL